MAHAHKSYLPAAGHDWLLPFYDPLVKLIGGDGARQKLIEQARIEGGERVLDIGCGTGSLVALLRRVRPDAHVTGLDPDPKALARARRKVDVGDAHVAFDQGFSDELPYSDASFDRVLSSFMFHHVSREQQAATLREVARVLVPGGSVHILDFGSEDACDEIPAMMRQAGLGVASEVAHARILLGRIAYYGGRADGAQTSHH